MIVKNANVFGVISDIFIKDGVISDIKPSSSLSSSVLDADDIFDAKGKTALPSFFNTHSHAAMTLLRGYADDMPLDDWLKCKIWPAEAKLTPEDIYWGSKLACVEMIRNGVTFFNDMYWEEDSIAEAVTEMGIRCALSATFIDISGNTDKLIKKLNKAYEKHLSRNNDKIIFTVAPHAIYTVSERLLKYSADFARERNLVIHMHLSETKKEYEDCIKDRGLKPAFYLDKLGLLSERAVLAHAVWLDDDEISLIADRNASVSYNPVSNMKLAVGKAFNYEKMKKAGINVSIGTDGCSSNNSLNMAESLKFASLLQKFYYDDPSIMSAEEAFRLGTENGARAFALNAGRLEAGSCADFFLLRPDLSNMTPGYNIFSDIVYSSGNNFADTVVSGGKIVMANGVINGEDEIVSAVCRLTEKFRERRSRGGSL